MSDSSSRDSTSPYQEPPTESPENSSNKPKRHTACELCRRRKLKCNGEKPSCETCTRLKKTCEYTTVHKKSGPQRGYLKKLESRLDQLEKLLSQTAEIRAEPSSDFARQGDFDSLEKTSKKDDNYTKKTRQIAQKRRYSDDKKTFDMKIPLNKSDPTKVEEAAKRAMSIPGGSIDLFGQDRISTSPPRYPEHLIHLNVEEPYPPQDIIDELVAKFFDGIFFDFIYKPRFMASLSTGLIKPHLLYAILLAGSGLANNHLFHLQDQLYEKTLKYLQKAECTGFGEELVNIQYVQALILVIIYDNKIGCFSRAWINCGKAIKAATQNNLHEIDMNNKSNSFRDENCYSSNVLNDKDERRRTFWIVYILDKYCSIGFGWPSSIQESSINSDLPMDDDAFRQGRAEPHISLQDLIDSPTTHVKGSQSSHALSVVFTHFMGQAFELMARPRKDDDVDPTGSWWSTEQKLARQLSSMIAIIPKLRFESGKIDTDDRTVSTQLFFHTSVMTLNRAAIIKLNELNGPFSSREFKIRCHRATSNIVHVSRVSTNIFKVLTNNPCGVFCLYAAAQSFITILVESRSISSNNDESLFDSATLKAQQTSQLDFLLTIFKILKPKMFMAECFYVKLIRDIRKANIVESSANEDLATKLQDAQISSDLDTAISSVQHTMQYSQFCAKPESIIGSKSPDKWTPSNELSGSVIDSPMTSSSSTNEPSVKINSLRELDIIEQNPDMFEISNESLEKNGSSAFKKPKLQDEPSIQNDLNILKTKRIIDLEPLHTHTEKSNYPTSIHSTSSNKTPSSNIRYTDSMGASNNLEFESFNAAFDFEMKKGTEDLDTLLDLPDILQWNSALGLDDALRNFNT